MPTKAAATQAAEIQIPDVEISHAGISHAEISEARAHEAEDAGPQSPVAGAPEPNAEEMKAAAIRAAIETLQATDARLLERYGYRLEPCDYYSPVNSLQFLEENGRLWSNPFVPLDIDWRIERQWEVAREIARYIPELADIPDHPREGADFYWRNGFWTNADALVQYGLLRSRKPAALVEIGCGFSSLLAARALGLNDAEGVGPKTRVAMVEPYPRRELLDRLPHGSADNSGEDWQLIESPLQRCPLEVFDRLGPGDVLFYDGSHCSRTASDVNWFFFRVLPRLKSGVLIHLHDIFLPRDYPRQWLLERRQSWNEQFVLQAFLMHNPAYRVEIANSFLSYSRPSELKALYGDVQPYWGASFWMVKAAS